MKVLFTILVTFFAGMGAGLGTGFAGMSAAAVISPMLITFLGMEPYMAVGIALSSDVLASAVSAYTYGKNKNLDVKNGLIMMVSVLACGDRKTDCKPGWAAKAKTAGKKCSYNGRGRYISRRTVRIAYNRT